MSCSLKSVVTKTGTCVHAKMHASFISVKKQYQIFESRKKPESYCIDIKLVQLVNKQDYGALSYTTKCFFFSVAKIKSE